MKVHAQDNNFMQHVFQKPLFRHHISSDSTLYWCSSRGLRYRFFPRIPIKLSREKGRENWMGGGGSWGLNPPSPTWIHQRAQSRANHSVMKQIWQWLGGNIYLATLVFFYKAYTCLRTNTAWLWEWANNPGKSRRGQSALVFEGTSTAIVSDSFQSRLC